MEKREEYGYRYRKIQGLVINGWEYTGVGNRVVITPPTKDSLCWRVWVPHLEASYPFEGDDAEERAFCAAPMFIEQHLE